MSLEPNPIKVLVFDKNSGDGISAPDLLGLFPAQPLAASRLTLTRVATLEAALECMREETFGLLLFFLSGNDTTALSEYISLQEIAPDVPGLVIRDELHDGEEARYLEAGAQAYLLAHDLTTETLQQKIIATCKKSPRENPQDELDILQGVARIGADAANENELIERTTALIGSTLYPDNFGILLLDRKRGELISHPSYHSVNPQISHRSLPLNKGICGSVALTGTPRRVADVRQEPDYLEVDPETRSELCVPLTAGKRILGVLNAESRRIDTFTVADERLMTTLAGQLATALLKSRSFVAEHTQRRRAEMLERLALALSSTLDLTNLLRLICQESQTLFEADAAYIWLIQEEDLVGFAGTGAGAEAFIGQHIPLSETAALSARTVQERRAVYVNEAATSPFIDRNLDALGAVKAVLGVPLIKGEHAIGVLMILNLHNARAFSPRDMDTAIVLGSHAAIAIDNARLFEDERRRRQEAETLREATAEIQASLDLSEVLDHILVHLERVVPYDSACIFLLENEHLVAVAGRNHPAPDQMIDQEYFLAEDSIAQEIQATRKPLILLDAQADERFKRWGGTDYVRGWMGLPLLARGRVLGILTLDAREVGAYGESEAVIAQSLANQAAMAIDNARLFEESQKQALALVGLYETALTVSSVLVTDALIARVREQVNRLLAPDSMGLFLYNEATDSFEITLAVEGGLPVPGIMGKTIPVNEGGLTGWVIQSRSPLLVQDILAQNLPVKPLHFSDPARSWLGVPLIARDQLIGALTLQSFKANAFTNSDRRYLESIAAQVAIALENANLYEKARRSVARQEALNNIVAAGASTIELNSLIELALDNTLRATGLKAGWVKIGSSLIAREIPENFIERLFQRAESLGAEAAEVLENLKIGDPSLNREHPYHILDKLLSGIGIQAIISAPILQDGARVGMLAVVTRDRHLWTHEEAALVEAVARELTAALERMQLFALTQSHAEHLKQLVPLSEALYKSSSIREVIEIIGHGAANLSGSTQVAFFVQSEENTVTCPWSLGLSEDNIQQITLRTRELYGGQLFHGTDPVLVPQISRLPVTSPLHALAEEADLAAYALWPLVYEGKVTAAIGCYYPTPRSWTQNEQDVMHAFVRQAAVAIENVARFEKTASRAEKLATLYELGKEITTTLDRDALLQLIAKQAVQLTGADKCLIVLTDTVASKVLQVAGHGFDPAQLDNMTYPELWEGIRSWVLRKREATYSTDVRNDPRTAAAALEVLARDPSPARSIAVAPLMVKEEIVGTLTLANEVDKPVLDQGDLDFLVMLANQAATGLERINWLEGQRTHTKNLENLHAASLQLASIRALRPVLETILTQLNQFIAADYADIFLYKDGALTFGAARTLQGPADHPSHPVGAHDLSQTFALKGKRIIVSDASRHPLYADHPWEGAEAGIPLSIGDRVRGILYIRFDHPHTFTGSELLMLEMFAEQAGIALENAQRVERLEVSLKALSTRSQISNALQEAADTQEISQVVAREAAHLVQADSVNIYLFDEEQQYLIAFGSIGQPGPESIPVREALPGAGMEDLTLSQTSETLPFNWAILEGTGSGLCLPLRTTGGYMIGVLLAGWEPEKGAATPDTEGEANLLLGTIAEIAANALKAAQSQQVLEGAYLQSVLALAKAQDAWSSPTRDHNQRLARLAESIAQALDCSDHELMTIRWAGLLHDIGKIRVPDKILSKPGPLTDAEWMILKRHPDIGAEIVSSVKKLATVAPIIRAHQEKFDGTGYPLGLAGQEIPRGARIVMVANAYTAMTSERVYRKARSHREAISELKRCSGSQFDPEIVEVFLQVIEGGTHPAASISDG